jgi:hypothetical protein
VRLGVSMARGSGEGARGFMAAEFDGWAIAQQRIAEEARERTGKLDLARLALEELPPEVAGLTHLRELELGWPYWCLHPALRVTFSQKREKVSCTRVSRTREE